MTDYPKVIQVGTMKVTVESAEEEARYLGDVVTYPAVVGVLVTPSGDVVDDVSPEPQTYVADAPVPQVEDDAPKKKTGAKKK